MTVSTVRGWSGDFGDSADLAARSVLHHRGAGSSQHQQERAEQFAKQPAPLVADGEFTGPARLTRQQSIGAWSVSGVHHRLHWVGSGLETVVVMADGLRHGVG